MKNKIELDNSDPWVILGKHFGYPDCCIESFIKTMGAMGNPLGASVSNNTGFIPCLECSRKIANKKITIESLIQNRQNSFPFPQVNQKDIDDLNL